MSDKVTKRDPFEDAPDYIQLFRMAMRDVENGINTMAGIYVDTITKYPDAKKKFQYYFPNYTLMFPRLELVSRGQLRSDLMLISLESRCGERLCRLPLSDQNEIMEHGVELLTENGDKMIVKGNSMTELQSRQLITPAGKLRNLPEQKAWLESQKTRAMISPVAALVREEKKKREEPVKVIPPWEIKDGELIVNKGQKFTKAQLFEIIQKMVL